MAEIIRFPKKKDSELEMEALIAEMEDAEDLGWETVKEVEDEFGNKSKSS